MDRETRATDRPVDRLYFNGVNGATGEYFHQHFGLDELTEAVRGRASKIVDEVESPLRGLPPDLDATDLREAGWGVIFPEDADSRVRDALKPLLDHRASQAEGLGKEFTYRAGESYLTFLERYDMDPGPPDPERVPYYLTIIGSPGEIPFGFQTDLDQQYAVGRIDLDTADDYGRYAGSVIEAEEGGRRLARRAALFGVENPDDVATSMSADDLIEPLLGELRSRHPDWRIEEMLRCEATRDRLEELVSGEAPAVLFTASHGMVFPPGDSRQATDQGAILCSDWPGPEGWRGEVDRRHYLAAADVPDDADLHGRVVFQFGCYGGGTPRWDQFAEIRGEPPRKLAEEPFVSPLPKRLLAHPGGGALAFISHVDMAWAWSFKWPTAGRQIQCFRSALSLLMRGAPAGLAMEAFGQRLAGIQGAMVKKLHKERHAAGVPGGRSLAALWTARNDARNYVLFGDPAVRLAVQDA